MDDNFFLQQCCPSGFKFHSAPQLNKRGGGIRLFYRSNIQLENFECQSSELFECCCATLKIQETIFCLIIVYRVPGGSVKLFFDNFLEDKKLCFDRILLLGNFNISLNVNNDASRLWSLFMEEFGLIQHVRTQTHKSGGLLDHVISSGEIRINVISNTFLTQSDHSLICFSISNWKPSKPKRQIFFRNWKLFRLDLYLNSLFSSFSIEQTSSVDSLE